MNGRLASIAGVVVATVLLIGAISVVQTKMTTIRTDHQLIDTTVIKDAPPTVAFVTVALGVGAGTTLVTLVRDVLLEPLPLPQSDGSLAEALVRS